MQKICIPGFYSDCLCHVLWLRLTALGAQFLVLVALQLTLKLEIPVGALLTVICLCLFTIWSFSYLRKHGETTERFFFFQLQIDIFALGLFLYFTGGASNPFAPLFLLPVVVAAATLPTRQTWLIATFAVICYSGLMFFHIPLHIHSAGTSDFMIHIWGMWIGFLLAAVLVAYFVSHIGTTLKLHDKALARAREEALRTEQIIAMGTLAAGTAHELGTPLSTMAILTRELEKTNMDNPELVNDLILLRDQITRCKAILSRMSCDAGQLQADSGRSMPVDQYIREIINEWSTSHPGREINSHYKGREPAPSIVTDRTLTQAIVNILDNAAEASDSTVEMETGWDHEKISITVHDHGRGLDPEIAQQVGQPFVSSKNPEDGLGLGLFLAYTTLDRLGGELQFSPAVDTGGNSARIILPLASVLAG